MVFGGVWGGMGGEGGGGGGIGEKRSATYYLRNPPSLSTFLSKLNGSFGIF